MFTGLIEDIGRITALLRREETTEIAIATLLAEGLTVGASLAVDGACLTVTRHAGGMVQATAAAETLDCTTLGGLRVGDRVNLERPLRLGDRLGGHLVSGHVDGAGRLQSRREVGPGLALTFAAPAPVARYLVEKGSVAIDGISLTVNHVAGDSFGVLLIPHTQTVTTLAGKKLGALVNLEADLIGKYVERLLRGHLGAAGATGGTAAGEIDLEFLREHGYTP